MRAACSLTLLVAFFVACAGAGESADGGDRVRNTVRASLGTSTANHVISAADDVLITRYGYQFERRVETAEDVRLETSWKELPATDDEKSLGIGFARIRITIRARPRDRSAGTYAATMNAEVEGRGPANDIWSKIPITDGRDTYLDEIVTFFENEFKGGVRPAVRNG